jgi:hypothetical protein
LGAILLMPFLLVTSYVGSIGAICWGQSSGVVSTATTNQIPGWYYHPLNLYLTEGRPGSIYVVQFLHWSSWVGDHDDTWQQHWEEVKAEYQEHLDEISKGEQ